MFWLTNNNFLRIFFISYQKRKYFTHTWSIWCKKVGYYSIQMLLYIYLTVLYIVCIVVVLLFRYSKISVKAGLACDFRSVFYLSLCFLIWLVFSHLSLWVELQGHLAHTWHLPLKWEDTHKTTHKPSKSYGRRNINMKSTTE